MSNSNTRVQTEYALDQEHIYEKYEKVFDEKKDLSIFFDDYEKSIPIKKNSFMKILSVIPIKKSITLNYILFSDTTTEEIVERNSSIFKRNSKLIQKDVYFKKSIPKSNKNNPLFKFDIKEFELFTKIFLGKISIESANLILKKQKDIKIKLDGKKCPLSYEKFVDKLSDGFIFVMNLDDDNIKIGKEEDIVNCNTKKEEEESLTPLRANHENKYKENCKIEKREIILEEKELPLAYENFVDKLSEGLLMLLNE
jgi:hypothetical protein